MKWVILGLGLFYGLFCASATLHYARGIKRPAAQKRRVWTTMVYGYAAIASLSWGLSALTDSLIVRVATQLAWVGIWFLVATIPCGMPFFNRRYVRPLRNLFFVILGALNGYPVITWIHIGYVPG